MQRRQFLGTLAGGGALALAGCTGSRDQRNAPGPAGPLSLGATTTIHDSGLLNALVSGFQERFGVTVKPVIRGTGAALRTARDGDVDVVLVHARPLEDAFLRDGAGINRRAVMVNDFLVVGPPADPAGVGEKGPIDAFRAIAGAEAAFLSRGDRSGTHIREQRIWSAAGIEPGGEWYRETGQGMGQTLEAARQLGAYTLTDRGTFLATENDDELTPLVDRGLASPPPLLRNQYATIATNPAHHDVAYPLAMAFMGYVTGPGQRRIREFRIDGRRGFRPAALDDAPNFEQYVPQDWGR